MPIPSEDDCGPGVSEYLQIFVEHRHNFVTFRDRESTSWAEIILDVDDDQNGMFVYRNLQPFALPLLCEIKITLERPLIMTSDTTRRRLGVRLGFARCDYSSCR
jgi:hypothetical protein